jgi:ubiquinone/menaquinone biosynthesis C-methylase UbiE
MSTNVSSFFDRYAHDFSAIYGNSHGPFDSMVNRLFRRSMALRYQRTLEGCDPIEGRSVLDIGCGPGHYSVALARRGAGEVLGLDFADGMLEVARERAEKAGVSGTCRFEKGDFLECSFDRQFDYTIIMGFMDYIAEPAGMIRKALSITKRRAFFSFPVAGGLLGWQRQLRYRSRCDLYLYTEQSVRELFSGIEDAKVNVERIDRDLFVTAEMQGR